MTKKLEASSTPQDDDNDPAHISTAIHMLRIKRCVSFAHSVHRRAGYSPVPLVTVIAAMSQPAYQPHKLMGG